MSAALPAWNPSPVAHELPAKARMTELSGLVGATLSSLTLIALAEVGDKSQLVCMVLAARHRALPVLAGATLAFLLLNGLAVLFGAGLAAWVPQQVVAALVALLFGAFGIHALMQRGAELSEQVRERSGRSVFATAFALIFFAEFGDKTQLAVAGLAVTLPPSAVWVGASAALMLVSAVGVWAGRTVLQRLPLRWLHRLSGVLFLVFSVLAAGQALAT
jgi:putative Ca2+/H+ antiporter (TMEM165/GDT1 family)